MCKFHSPCPRCFHQLPDPLRGQCGIPPNPCTARLGSSGLRLCPGLQAPDHDNKKLSCLLSASGLTSQPLQEVGPSVFVSLMRQWKLREVKELARGHPARKRWQPSECRICMTEEPASLVPVLFCLQATSHMVTALLWAATGLGPSHQVRGLASPLPVPFKPSFSLCVRHCSMIRPQ